MTRTHLDFDAATLPWVDREDFPAEASRRLESGKLTPDEKALLDRWREDGYLLLENRIAPERIDRLLAEVERAWQERPDVKLLVEGKGVQAFPDVAPRSELTHHHFRIMDFQDVSGAARDLILDADILGTLRLIFGETPVAMQSLYFEYGSEQGTHQDFPYVQSGCLSHLVGCWIACEDVDDSNGPLFYNLGSHRLPKFDWGGGSLTFDGKDESQVAEFEAFLAKQQEEHALERTVFHAKKGDVLFWHAALVHGGSPSTDRDRTRRSLVVHYSTETAYPRDRRDPAAEPRRLRENGGMLYLPPGPPPSFLKRLVRKIVPGR